MLPGEKKALAELKLASVAVDREEEEIRQAWIAEVQDRMKSVRERRARLQDFQDLYK